MWFVKSSFCFRSCHQRDVCVCSQERRREFEANLEKAGLELETEDKSVRDHKCRTRAPPRGQCRVTQDISENSFKGEAHCKLGWISHRVVEVWNKIYSFIFLYQDSKDQKTYFLKIHAPWDVLATFADVLKIKVPFKASDIPHGRDVPLEWLSHPFRLPEHIMHPQPDYFTYPFDKGKTDFFLINDKDTFFPPSTRNRIVSVFLSLNVIYLHFEHTLENTV